MPKYRMKILEIDWQIGSLSLFDCFHFKYFQIEVVNDILFTVAANFPPEHIIL